MRKPVDADRVRTFLAALGREADRPTTVYLVGGATAILEGWRATTIDLDICIEPESDALLRAIQRLKDDQAVNVELASPLDFLPELPGWRDRSPYVTQEGHVTFRQFDFYAQALAKLERGFDQDLADVRAMIGRGLVDPAELRRLFEAVAPSLHRFPAVDGGALRASVHELE